MNLAIHDAARFCELVDAGCTTCWKRRGIVAWVPPAAVRARPGLGRLVEDGWLHQLEIAPEHEGFSDIFRQRLRPGLAGREATLLCLADVTGSVVLAGERMVVEQALALDLHVWSGDAAQLDAFFPLPSVSSPELPPPPPIQVACRIFLSNQFPSARQVPVCDEPMHGIRTRTRGLIAKPRSPRSMQLN